MNIDELLHKAVETLKDGQEVFWYDGDVKHIHSLKKPHPFKPFPCFGQCCNQPERLNPEDTRNSVCDSPINANK